METTTPIPLPLPPIKKMNIAITLFEHFDKMISANTACAANW